MPHLDETPAIDAAKATCATSPQSTRDESNEKSPITGSASTAIPCSISAVLKSQRSALLVNTINTRTLLYHQEALSGTWLGLYSVSNLILKKDSAIQYHLWLATKRVLDQYNKETCPEEFKNRYRDTLDQLMFEVGAESTSMINGPHVTFVDPRRHKDAQEMVDQARRRSQLFYRKGFTAENVLISIPATEAGLLAARVLQKEGINVNIYLVGSLLHAAACAETGAAAVTIYVGQVLEWFEQQRSSTGRHLDLEHHPGIETIQTMMAYLRLHSRRTRIIGTQFRKMAEIALLADFDAVCVSTFQLDRLEWNIARYTPRDKPRNSVLLRAEQARYPAGLLCDDGEFLTRLSSGSCHMIMMIMYRELAKMSRAMEVIEKAVEKEVITHLADRSLKMETVQGFGIERESSSDVRTASSPLVDGAQQTLSALFKLRPVMEDSDEVF